MGVETRVDTQPMEQPVCDAHVVLRGVKLRGFECAQLNVLFVEHPDPAFRVGGRETYWAISADYFLYRSQATNTWGIGKAKRFEAIQNGKSNGVAHSPEGYEIWDTQNANTEALAKKGWREWVSESGKWVTRAGSGVENRGKVRPKISPCEKEVQTEHHVETKSTQTEPPPQSPSLGIMAAGVFKEDAYHQLLPPPAVP